MLDFSCTLVMKNDMIWYNEGHSLLLTYLKPCLKAYVRRKMSTNPPTSLFGVILGHIIIRFHCQNIRKITDFGVDSQPGGKWEDGE